MPKVLGSLATHREQVRERVFDALRGQLYERGFDTVTLSGVAAFARLQLRRLAEFHLPPGQALAGALDPAAYRRIAAHADPISDRLVAVLRAGAADGSMVDDDPHVLAAVVSAALSSRRIVEVEPDALDATVETAVAAVLRAVSTIVRD